MGKWLEDPYGFVERNLRLCNLDKCEINLKQIGYEMIIYYDYYLLSVISSYIFLFKLHQ